MVPSPIPANEDARLEALRRYRILDTPEQREFDDVAGLAAALCDAPIALISLIDADRQWFKARVGLRSREMPRNVAFCAHAILQHDLLVVTDALADARFADNPLVTGELNIRFYAGAPLITPEGHALGTLCVIDVVPRKLSEQQQQALRVLSSQLMAQLELGRAQAELEQAAQETRKTTEALRTSEEFQDRLIACSQDCIKVLDLDGRLQFMNAGGMRVLEVCDFDSVANSNWLDFWQGPDRAAAEEAVAKAREGGIGRFMGFFPTVITRTPMWFDVVISPILDSQGRPEKLLALSRDVTERKNTESALRAAHQFNQEIINSAAEGIIVYDMELRYLVFNPFIQELTGRRAEEVLGRRAPDVFPWIREMGLDKMMERAVQGEVVHVPDLLVHPQTGREIWESVTFGPHRDAEGKIIGAIALIRDISERKLAEKALKDALAEVETLKNRLQAENKYLQDEIRREHNFEEIVGGSPSLLELLRKVERVAPTDSTVMLYGETGTGKELIARALHNSSKRKDRPLVKVNCGAIPSALVESELFGHVKGAFTGALERRVGRFELADGGTLFLDEVGELPLETQVKLLRILQEQEFEPVGSSKTVHVDVRILAATNRDLEEAVQAGRFRPDLFYRLNVLPLHVPALRERREDIPHLALFFLDRYCKKAGKQMEGVSQETMELLQRYSWPGNIRELQNVMERGVALAQGSILHLGPDLLPVEGASATSSTLAQRDELDKDNGTASRLPLEEIEKLHIVSILRDTKGVIEGPNGAAGILGLHPNTLRSRMKKLGISRI
ncbi:MAG TPA: sigma 54-interacting transcriptional regulator [Candidatus Angelobacter sp.]